MTEAIPSRRVEDQQKKATIAPANRPSLAGSAGSAGPRIRAMAMGVLAEGGVRGWLYLPRLERQRGSRAIVEMLAWSWR